MKRLNVKALLHVRLSDVVSFERTVDADDDVDARSVFDGWNPAHTAAYAW